MKLLFSPVPNPMLPPLPLQPQTSQKSSNRIRVAEVVREQGSVGISFAMSTHKPVKNNKAVIRYVFMKSVFGETFVINKFFIGKRAQESDQSLFLGIGQGNSQTIFRFQQGIQSG